MVTSSRWLLVAAGGVGGLLLAARLLRPDLSGLRVRLDVPARGRCGDQLEAVLHVHHHGRRAVPALTALALPPGADRAVPVTVPPLQPGDTARLRFAVPLTRRGVFEVGVVQLDAWDALGLSRAQATHSRSQPVVVHPAAVAPADVRLSRVPGSRRTTPSVHGTDEVAGLRPWREGEDQRHVHWRASARRGRLVVVERDVPLVRRRWVLVVCGRATDARDEQLLATAAATVQAMTARGHEVDVLAWRGDATRAEWAARTPTEVLDWFARVDVLGVPSQYQLQEALPEGCDALTLVALGGRAGDGGPDAAAAWVADLADRLRPAGIRVQRGFEEVGR